MEPPCFPQRLEKLRIRDLSEEHQELLEDLVSALDSDVVLTPNKRLTFLTELWLVEKAKGKTASKKLLKQIERFVISADNLKTEVKKEDGKATRAEKQPPISSERIMRKLTYYHETDEKSAEHTDATPKKKKSPKDKNQQLFDEICNPAKLVELGANISAAFNEYKDAAKKAGIPDAEISERDYASLRKSALDYLFAKYKGLIERSETAASCYKNYDDFMHAVDKLGLRKDNPEMADVANLDMQLHNVYVTRSGELAGVKAVAVAPKKTSKPKEIPRAEETAKLEITFKQVDEFDPSQVPDNLKEFEADDQFVYKLIRMITNQDPANSAVLEFGFGANNLVKLLRKSGVPAIGIDVDPKNISRQSKELIKANVFIQGSAENLKEIFGDKKFDIIYSFRTMSDAGLTNHLRSNHRLWNFITSAPEIEKLSEQYMKLTRRAILESASNQLKIGGMLILRADEPIPYLPSTFEQLGFKLNSSIWFGTQTKDRLGQYTSIIVLEKVSEAKPLNLDMRPAQAFIAIYNSQIDRFKRYEEMERDALEKKKKA